MNTNALVLSKLVPGGNLQQYINTVNAFPVLSVERERELARRLFEDDDLDAARELVLSHLRFVVHVSRTYEGYGLPQEDLIQEGNVGLMKAVNKFNPNRGVRLVTFAVHWIKAEMNEYVLRNWRILKVATSKAQRKLFYKLRSKKQEIGQLNTLTAAETRMVAKDLGVKPEEVHEMEVRLSGQDVPFDPPEEDDFAGDDDEVRAPSDVLHADHEDPAVLAEDEQWSAMMHRRLQAALEALDDRSREIVYSRFIDEEGRTLEDLGAEFGISAERVRQLERRALADIKESLGSELTLA
ncbi:MAG: RNA polymerase sigma factor RpoH [Gammaproteobacteria bacterium]|nr:RNA polymerase sigma factor RpoH [Gammaproteobacteria bacterium]